MGRYAGTVLKELDRVFNQGTVAGLTEGKLLERYVAVRDEVAFAALVARHGPMVLGVCRRILHDEHDVEDAFQATFLVLVRRAAAIRRRELVGHWLHGVAHRVAVRARAHSARRHVHEPTGLHAAANNAEIAPPGDANRDLRAVLDDELARLPGSLRMPVVLCYLEGLTHDEAARRLRWPVGTVRSRMARARAVLRRRLARRGVVTDGAALGSVLARQPVPLGVIDSTVRAAFGFASAQTNAAGVASTTAAALARGVLRTMMISKLKVFGTIAMAGILAVGGAQTLARQQGGMAARRHPVTVSPDQGDRTNVLLGAVDRIDNILDDIEHRNRDVQTELRLLRKEIAGLRAGESEKPKAPPTDASARGADAASRKPGLGAPRGDARLAGEADPRARVASGAGDGAGPAHFDNGQHILVTSPRGDRVALYNRSTLETKTARFSVPTGSRHIVSPVWGNGVMALHVKGPKIARIAVYVTQEVNAAGQGEGWYPQDLREPVDEASPTVIDWSAAYVLGRYVYAFSRLVKRWDVLELPPDSQPTLGQAYQTFTVRNGDHLYEFMQADGHWHDINFNAILDLPPTEGSKNVRVPRLQ